MAAQKEPARRHITQRRINEIAAAADNARRALTESTGLRAPDELLSLYFNRICEPLTGETPTNHAARLNQYVAIVARADAIFGSITAMPALETASLDNRTIWGHVTSMAHDYSRQAEALQSDMAKSAHSGPGGRRTVAHDLLRCVNYLVALFVYLRDALP